MSLMDENRFIFEEEEETIEEIPDELPSFEEDFSEDSTEIESDVKTARIEHDIVSEKEEDFQNKLNKESSESSLDSDIEDDLSNKELEDRLSINEENSLKEGRDVDEQDHLYIMDRKQSSNTLMQNNNILVQNQINTDNKLSNTGSKFQNTKLLNNSEVLFFSKNIKSSDFSNLSTNDVITNMEKKFSLQAKYDEISLIEKQIEELLAPLSGLESQWRNLKQEIRQKQEMLKNTENEIINLTLKAKELSSKRKVLEKKLSKF